MAPPTRSSRRTVLKGLAVAGPLLLCGCGRQADRPVGGPTLGGAVASTLLPERSRVLHYGRGPNRYGELTAPEGAPPPGGWPVAVLLHGGFWRTGFGPDLMVDLARSLVADGWASWNVQYSAVGDRDGGWPGTFRDVAAAIDHLAEVDDPPLDRSRVLAVGHSAGGHLALWAASRPGQPAEAPGAGPSVAVGAVAALAPITDLLDCVVDDLGEGACRDLMGVRPREDLGRYLLASPIERLPSGVPTLLAHGARDRVVPVRQSRRYLARATQAGERPDLLVVENAGHFDPVFAGRPAWQRVRERLPDLLA